MLLQLPLLGRGRAEWDLVCVATEKYKLHISLSSSKPGLCQVRGQERGRGRQLLKKITTVHRA